MTDSTVSDALLIDERVTEEFSYENTTSDRYLSLKALQKTNLRGLRTEGLRSPKIMVKLRGRCKQSVLFIFVCISLFFLF